MVDTIKVKAVPSHTALVANATLALVLFCFVGTAFAQLLSYTAIGESTVYIQICNEQKITVTQKEYMAVSWPKGCNQGYAAPDISKLSSTTYYQEQGQKIILLDGQIAIVPDTITIDAYVTPVILDATSTKLDVAL